MKKTLLTATAGLILSWASPMLASDISLSDAMARVTPRGVGAAFMTITNKADQDRLVISATADGAGKVELHTHINDNGVMRMRQVENFSVPAGGEHILEPGGDHVMLFDVSNEVSKQGHISVTLQFDDGTSSTVDAPIMSMKKGHGEHGKGKKSKKGKNDHHGHGEQKGKDKKKGKEKSY